MADAGATTSDSVSTIGGDTGSDEPTGFEVSEEGGDPFGSQLISDDAPLTGPAGKDDLDEEGVKAKPKAKKPSKPKKESDAPKVLRYKDVDGERKSSPQTDTDTGSEEMDETTAAFLEALGLDKDAKPEAQGDPEEEEDLQDVDQESRAGRRISKLLEERKQAKEHLEAARASAWEHYNQSQQLQQSLQTELSRRDQHIAALSAKVEMLSQGIGAQRQEQLTPEQQMEKEWIDKLNGAIDAKLSPLQKENEQLRTFLKKQADRQQLGQIKQRFSSEADQALQHALRDIDPEAIKGAEPMMKRLVYAIAYDLNAQGHQISMNDAAAILRDTALRIGLGFHRNKSKQNKAQTTRAGTVPQPAPKTASSGVKGDADPPHELLRYNNWADVVEWDMAGRPALKRPPKKE